MASKTYSLLLGATMQGYGADAQCSVLPGCRQVWTGAARLAPRSAQILWKRLCAMPDEPCNPLIRQDFFYLLIFYATLCRMPAVPFSTVSVDNIVGNGIGSFPSP
jgi:hypothetical protein